MQIINGHKVWSCKSRPARPVADQIIRYALQPVLDRRKQGVEPRFPCRAVFQFVYRPGIGKRYFTSCRGLDGGTHGDLHDHREFDTLEEAVRWMAGDDQAGRPYKRQWTGQVE